ncbi:uncharacterized protein LOC110445308 [Mizuhopecten yessoensis]|uniref:uncharacterized protein LOC110445308 n=1 Tax=Mizuhopecten yessoensis TaxID=6573 RepID=UPI000B4584DF|nr:uncharacterized protein LOC110445308 [Mizuhopecten yessoensis]
MKLAVFLVIILPLAMSAPHEDRAFSFNPILQSLLNVFHADELKKIVASLVADLGTDQRKGECQTECDTLVDHQLSAGSINTITHTFCPMACTSLQQLAQHYNIPIPSTPAPTA